MARRKKDAVAIKKVPAKAIALAERGIHTGADFASVMSALLSDTIAGRIHPQVTNAACNVGNRLLKAVELQHKYGKANGVGTRLLALTPIGKQARATVQ